MKTIKTAFKIFLIFTVLTGMIYPLLITGLAKIFFPFQANGSLLQSNELYIGSKLIGQSFDSNAYFMSRPSAVSYNPLPSGGSNYGPTSKILKNLVDERRLQFTSFNGLDKNADIPSEMLFESASGLDPHISPEAAYLQVERIAKCRKFNNRQRQELIQLIQKQTEKPQLLILGKERVNVLLLNLMTDKIQ